MLLLKLLAPFATLFVATWQLLLDRNLQDRHTRILFFAIVFTAVISSVIIYFDDQGSQSLTSQLTMIQISNDSLRSLVSIGEQKAHSERTIFQNALQEKSHEIAELSKKNIELSSELSKISLKIVATVTGGESFCYLFPFISDEKMNTINFKLIHNGDYPVYDLLIRIWDDNCLADISRSQLDTNTPKLKNKIFTYDEWKMLRKDPEFIFQNKERNRIRTEKMRDCLLLQKNIGTVIPNKTTNMMDPIYISLTIPSGVDTKTYNQVYHVSMIARNGNYKQEIKISIPNSRYDIYSRVDKMIPNSKLVTVREFKTMDNDFAFGIKYLK